MRKKECLMLQNVLFVFSVSDGKSLFRNWTFAHLPLPRRTKEKVVHVRCAVTCERWLRSAYSVKTVRSQHGSLSFLFSLFAGLKRKRLPHLLHCAVLLSPARWNWPIYDFAILNADEVYSPSLLSFRETTCSSNSARNSSTHPLPRCGVPLSFPWNDCSAVTRFCGKRWVVRRGWVKISIIPSKEVLLHFSSSPSAALLTAGVFEIRGHSHLLIPGIRFSSKRVLRGHNLG